MPVISIGRPVGIVLEYRNRRNLWVVLIDRVRYVDFTKVLGQLDVLLRRHLLIPEKDDLMRQECIVNSLCTVAGDVAEINIDVGAQGWSETFNLNVSFPAVWPMIIRPRPIVLLALRSCRAPGENRPEGPNGAIKSGSIQRVCGA